MARRGTRAQQYFQIAAYYGIELIEDLNNPHVPEFVLVHAARRAAHYALTALSLEEKGARKTWRNAPTSPSARSWFAPQVSDQAQGC